MKIRIINTVWLMIAIVCLNLRAQTFLSQTVAVDANGVVLSPTNFWTANAVTLGGMLGASSNSVSLAQFAVYTNGISSSLAAKQNQSFPLTFSGLTVTVGPGSILWPNGSALSFPGGSYTLFPNFTNYLTLNYATARLHSLYRYLGGGGEHLIATLVTGSAGVIGTPLVNADFNGLPTGIGAAKSKLLHGASRWDVVLLGDSTTEASGTGTMWRDLLFSPGAASFGYNVTNAAAVVYRNFGLGGINADYGLALVSRSAQSFGYNFQGYGGHGGALDFAGLAGGTSSKTFTPQSGFSRLWSPFPDLVILGYGINATQPQSGAYAWNDLETLGRVFQAGGVSTLYLTQNDFANSPLSLAPLAAAESTLVQAIGGAIADTAAYVDERNRQGVNTYADAVHSNQAGWIAWAEAILGVLNPYPQRPAAVTPLANRVLDPAVPAEAPYLGLGATFVGGTVISRSAGVTATNTAGGVGPNYLPYALGSTTVYNVPGTPSVATNFIDYYHSCWTSASLAFERGVGAGGVGTNSFNGYVAWLDHVGVEHWIKGISFSDDFSPGAPGPYQRPGMIDLVSISQILPAITNLSASALLNPTSSSLWNHGAVRIAITNGNARILGVLFRGPRHHKLPLGRGATEWILTPSWFDDTADPFGWYPHLLATDALGDTLGLRFRGRGIQLAFRRSVSAGQITLYGNGTPLQIQELYATGRPPLIFQWLPSGPGAGGESELLLNYIGDNAAKAGPTFGYHSVELFDAELID